MQSGLVSTHHPNVRKSSKFTVLKFSYDLKVWNALKVKNKAYPRKVSIDLSLSLGWLVTLEIEWEEEDCSLSTFDGSPKSFRKYK